jgi:hypothetical protein
MAEETPPESASPDKVLDRLAARRDQLHKDIIKFRFRWSFLIIACLIGTAVDAAIDAISGTVSPAYWYQGALVGAGFYLVPLLLIRAGLRADLMQTNSILAGTDANPLTSTIPPLPPRRRRLLPKSTWKDQPLVVATLAVAGTTILMFTAVIPTWLKEKDNEIAELKTEPTKLKSELDALRGQLNRMESENLKLRRDLDRLSPDTLFSLDDVYPRGFRAVRIGARIDLLYQVYATEAERKDEEYWVTVAFKKPHLFRQIAYYYDENAKVKTVTSLLFFFDNQDGKTFNALKEQLIEMYSQKTMKEVTKRAKTKLVWSGIHKHSVELGDGTLAIDPSE